MDNHPIPQDVTGFQFRLIGDMTVKQFAYVAVGGILAVVFLYAPLPFLLRIPFMILFAGVGVVMAFVPIEGRPVDLMVSYFLKALFAPSQYSYQKLGGVVPIFAYREDKQQAQTQTIIQTPQERASKRDFAKEQKLKTYLSSHHSKKLNPLDRREEEFLQKLFPQAQTISEAQVPVASPVPASLPAQTPVLQPAPQPQTPIMPEENEVADDLPVDENELAQELTRAQEIEDSQTDFGKKQEAHVHVAELEKQLDEIKSQKEKLEEELKELRAQQASLAKEAAEPSVQPPADDASALAPITPTVRKISSEAAKDLGLPHIPEDPNLILGIVKDPRGNALSNILVEVKDQNGNPARAFRTNQLGHFASATQLSDGMYTIDFEDPKKEHMFDTIEINAKGEVIMPIEVISHDEREELRKALFN